MRHQLTIRALDLCLNISTHSQVTCINFKEKLPGLQAIHVIEFFCEQCQVSYCNGFSYGTKMNPEKTNAGVECLRATLGKLHPNVPYDRIILGICKPYCTLQQLLASN
ncbi:hypothetical protein TYRP_022721 [Tyrophagus putrescentiae]|nr:hypothetical protein TYRP_022721 [Tyrophagus putrescentiae]